MLRCSQAKRECRLSRCAPQQTAFPQDINLLNEARENLESLIDDLCFRFHYYKPRMYRQNARKDYLSLAKCRKRTAKKIRKAIKKQFQYVNRDLGYRDLLLAQDDVYLKPKQMERLHVIRELVEQQRKLRSSLAQSLI